MSQHTCMCVLSTHQTELIGWARSCCGDSPNNPPNKGGSYCLSSPSGYSSAPHPLHCGTQTCEAASVWSTACLIAEEKMWQTLSWLLSNTLHFYSHCIGQNKSRGLLGLNGAQMYKSLTQSRVRGVVTERYDGIVIQCMTPGEVVRNPFPTPTKLCFSHSKLMKPMWTPAFFDAYFKKTNARVKRA